MSKVNRSTEDKVFEQRLAAYAEVAIRVGLNLQLGQRLVIDASIEAAPMVRRIASEAYRAGAELVDVLWNDPSVTLTRFKFAPDKSFDLVPSWRQEAMTRAGERGDAVIYVDSPNPDLLADQDPERVRRHQRAGNEAMRSFNESRNRQMVNWTILTVPNEAWAASVFPKLPAEAGKRRLWDEVFKAVRVDGTNPVAAWDTHIATLDRILKHLNNRHYKLLRYRAPGTNLEIGLPQEHRWMNARFLTQGGSAYIANLPTEEVFTSPHSGQAEGVVTASMPLSYGGVLIENFGLRFEGGRVVEAWADSGLETLEGILETDEGARHLGEVALVPNSSPISQSGLLFFNTLYDENASSHMAVGRAFSFTLNGWESKNDKTIEKAGINQSLTHVDFMVGSGEMDIDGVRENGSVEAILHAGEWVS
jgi:aminopeptidase